VVQTSGLQTVVVGFTGMILGTGMLALATMGPSKPPLRRSPQPSVETTSTYRRNLDEVGSDNDILSQIDMIQELTRVTEKPHLMSPLVSLLCKDVYRTDVHGDRYYDVFLTENAVEAMQTGKGTYPTGSFVIKAKYPSQDRSSKVELFTVMRKMSSGYAPEIGDWEFSVVNGDANQVLARGKIGSCIECHVSYADTDYVTRKYMTKGD
jgi:hypothetical protein